MGFQIESPKVRPQSVWNLILKLLPNSMKIVILEM